MSLPFLLFLTLESHVAFTMYAMTKILASGYLLSATPMRRESLSREE